MASKLITVVASAAKTANGSATFGSQSTGGKALVIQLDQTAHSGTTPTLDVVVEDSVDGTNYNAVTGGSFTQRTTSDGRECLRITAPFTEKLRVRWTVGGTTPSYTFSVTAEFVGE
jgi:hypothetical protein